MVRVPMPKERVKQIESGQLNQANIPFNVEFGPKPGDELTFYEAEFDELDRYKDVDGGDSVTVRLTSVSNTGLRPQTELCLKSPGLNRRTDRRR